MLRFFYRHIKVYAITSRRYLTRATFYDIFLIKNNSNIIMIINRDVLLRN